MLERLTSAIAANRFGLGARPGDLDAIGSHSRDWLRAQLESAPPRLDDRQLRPSSEILVEALDLRREIQAQRRAEAAGDDTAAFTKLPQLLRPIYTEEATVRFRQAVLTDRPFVERITQFWTNHFAVSVDKNLLLGLAGSLEREAIRPNILGHFGDLLLAVEQHPAMLLYLDNHLSIGPNSKAAQNRARQHAERKSGINENLARETLELHTLGVGGGYTQTDVTSYAEVITGWSIGGDPGRHMRGEPGKFVFRPEFHEPGPKVVLGKRYPDTGYDQGVAVLRDLANHHSTARFIATKLARHFIADDPPEKAVERIAQAYTKQRKVPEVVKIWREYRVQDPKNPISYQEAAEIEEKSGNWTGALEDWNALLAIKPSNGVAANTMNHMAGDLVQLKRPDEARAQYNAVLALDATGNSAPKELQVVEAAAVKTERLAAMRGMAALALQEKKPAEAIAAWEKIKAEEAVLSAKTGLYDPEPYLTIGRLYEDQKKYEEAAAQYKALLQLTPKNGEVWAQLGRLYESQNKQGEAIAAYQQAAALSKAPLQDGMRIAQAYQRFNQPDKAIAQYQLLRRQYPQDVSLLTALALALRQAGRDADALEVYDTLIKVDSQLAWVREYKAIALLHLKRYPEARALYVAQVDKAPQNRQTYADLANAYKEEGKPDDYLPWLQLRLEKSLTNSVLMGVVLDEFMRQNRADAGYAYLKGIVEQHKTQRPVLEAFATVLAEHSKRVEAIEVYRQIAALAPKDTGAQLVLADQLDMNTQKEEAAKIYKALLARPDIPADQKLALHRRFAQRCVLQGDLAEAVLQYQEVLHTAPKDFEAIAELGQTLVAAHRENEAVPYYQQLSKETALPPVLRADMFAKLGDIYAQQNHKPEAIAHYHEAQKLNPQDPTAAEGLKRLGEK